MSQWLIFLAIIPLSSLHLTKNFNMRNRWMWNGIAFGAVVAPVSFGLLQMTYIPVLGKFAGLVGLVGNLVHGSVGYICLLGSGMLEFNTLMTGPQLCLVNLVNGLLFAYAYGIIGHSIDEKLKTSAAKLSVMAA
ncbi:hypothetical protein JWJ90_19575 [Desulfobulbus rhabdoformis]|uniref:hypothetical protein n=1 Tax=Desulfobulbus rhabdoformis TaxID=34032 RepID=UPI0019642A18|nr:hypothetical protein [Desulfobulbus rhabdoformis]MBM9616470.1 hypothetical protein [Desulfobulbus rhabdoformis]